MTGQNNSKLDFSNIFNYFGFCLSFCFISYCLKWIFINKISEFNLFNVLTIFEMHNTGAAFSILENYSKTIIIASIIALIVISGIAVIYSKKITMINTASMGMLSAGITMNLIERIHDGYVTDYISLNILPSFSTVFNIPDVMIIFGAFLLVYCIIKGR